MWQLVQANGNNADFNCISPTARTKHATCTNQDGFIYLYGGKSGNMSLKDLWRFDTENNYWEEIKCSGDCPQSLQEHSMIAWNNKIYIFGGEVGYCSSETPLWQLNLDTWTWYKFGSANTNSPGISSTQPTGRSGHTAVLFENAIYVYGGYQQLKGSLTELWKFDLCNESWSLISGPCISTIQPPGRYYHSAVIHGNQMYVYGGMNNLNAKSDFWRWNLIDKTWTKIKCNRNPGELHGHSAIKAFNCMFIFGGERNGNFLQELWRFNFDTENWDKIQTSGMLPSPRSKHTAISNPFIDLNHWDASSSISSNNSNQSDTNRLSQFSNYNVDDLEIKSSNSKSTKNEDARFKNDKNKENKCDCNRSNEGTIRKFFRKKIGRSKLVRSVSTNSYNISHNENCNFYRTNLLNQNTSMSNKSSMKKSNTCYEETIKTEQNENCLINSNTIESLSTNLQDCITRNISNSSQLDKNDKNYKLNNVELNSLQEEQNKPEPRKYDIGQSSALNSPTNEENDGIELLSKINQLQNELESKTIKNNYETLNNGKKQRPKSELINGLSNLDEDMTYSWDFSDLIRESDKDSTLYYSFCFSSPSNAARNLRNENALKNSSTTDQVSPNQLDKFKNEPIKMRKKKSKNFNRNERAITIHGTYCKNDELKTTLMLNSNLNEINESELSNDEEMSIIDGKESQTIKSNKENNLTDLNKNQQYNQQINENEISPTKNTVLTNNTTTICSPMSTNSVMCSTISQSLSQSSGYQSTMEDSLFDNSNTTGSNDNSMMSNSTSVNHTSNQVSNHISNHVTNHVTNNHLNNHPNNHQNNRKSLNDQQILNYNSIDNEQSIVDKNCQIKMRNHPNQLKLTNQRTTHTSCLISNFDDYNQKNSINEPINQTNQKDNNQMNKKLPNSSSNVEISLNQNRTNYQLTETWDRKMIKTFSTNGFKDTIYKNVERNSNSFLNLSDLIKKKKDKKKKKEYQFCMLVFGGNEKSNGNQTIDSKQPISVYKLYI